MPRLSMTSSAVAGSCKVGWKNAGMAAQALERGPELSQAASPGQGCQLRAPHGATAADRLEVQCCHRAACPFPLRSTLPAQAPHLGQQLELGEGGHVAKVEAKGVAQLNGLHTGRCWRCKCVGSARMWKAWDAIHHCNKGQRVQKVRPATVTVRCPPAPPSCQCEQTGCRCRPSSAAAPLPV